MSISTIYGRFRYRTEVISRAVWMYFRFALSFRDMEEMLAYRGIIVTDETVRQRTLRFGQDFVNTARRKPPQRRSPRAQFPKRMISSNCTIVRATKKSPGKLLERTLTCRCRI